MTLRWLSHGAISQHASTTHLAADTNLEIRVHLSLCVVSDDVYIHVVQRLENLTHCAAGSSRQTQPQ